MLVFLHIAYSYLSSIFLLSRLSFFIDLQEVLIYVAVHSLLYMYFLDFSSSLELVLHPCFWWFIILKMLQSFM